MEARPRADVVASANFTEEQRKGRAVELPLEDLAFVTEDSLVELLSPEALNSGNLVDIFQRREEDFMPRSILDVTYLSPDGRMVQEKLFVDDHLPNERPRICISSGAVRATHRAIAILTRKVAWQGARVQLENWLIRTLWNMVSPRRARIRISGFEVLTPNNQAAPLAEALTEKGPVVVSVDGSPWQTYANGVFDGCDKDAILSHAVLAKGFGIEDGRKYWLIQNSWGADWGESGHIRLLRHDDNDAWCGTDTKPQEGSGCDGGPPEITVCGMCGILYESVVPSGVYLEGSEDAFDSP